MMRREEDPQTKVLNELSSMIVHVLRAPPPIPLPFPAPDMPSSSSRRNTASWRVSPASFATLFIGISLAMMLFGFVIFLVGFILMPWVIGLVLIFYFVGVLSDLSSLGRAFLCWAVPQRDGLAWKRL